MTKKFDELRQKMSPERRNRNEAEADRMLLEVRKVNSAFLQMIENAPELKVSVLACPNNNPNCIESSLPIHGQDLRMMDTDSLTGLPTGAALDGHLSNLSSGCDNPLFPMVFVDIDGFQWANYKFGHVFGDEALRQIASWLNELALKHKANAFRIAGEEFLIVFPCGQFDGAKSVGAMIVETCSSLGIPYERPDDSRTTVTLSAVVFSERSPINCRLRETREVLANLLYEAKQSAQRDFSRLVINL